MRRSTVRGFMFISVLALLLGGAGQARGVIIHESATLGPTGQLSGYSVGSLQFLGSRFHIDTFVQVTEVGGHLFSFRSGNQRLFAAIVVLAGPNALPSGSPFDDTLLAVTTFDPGTPSSDFLTPLSVTLAPGDYALIFGSGLVGATGEGAMPSNNMDIPGHASYFAWWSSVSSWRDGGSNGTRFVVVGQVLGETADFTISPPSGRYLTTQRFDLGLIVDAFGLSIVGGSATFDGVDVTAALGGCVIPGTLLSGGQTFRCPGLAGGILGLGTHTFRVILDLSNGLNISDTVTWEILDNSEP